MQSRSLKPMTPTGAFASFINEEAERFERFGVSLWMRFSVIGVSLSVSAALFVSPSLGVASLFLVVLSVLWFASYGAYLKRRGWSARLRLVNTCVEGTLPWAFLLVLAVSEGPSYALGSWVPPLLFAFLLLSHTLRLRVLTPIVLSVVGAGLFLCVYAFFIRDRLGARADDVLFQWPTQITRAFAIVLGGVVGAVGGHAFRRVLARTEIMVRESDLFGKYRLVRRIDRGGMGEVFEAVYAPEGGFERRVAIKRIHGHLAESEEFLSLFREEAEMSARLAHPNVVQVMDFGRVRGRYYLAMEYVDGLTLSRLRHITYVHEKPVPEAVVGLIARDLLSGLHYAHEVVRGADGNPLRIVHRDLCPQNVLISRNGEVKIADFGVARALKDRGASQTQTVVGHSAYIAPEQALAEPIGTQADLFSLGVILYELLTGRRLFWRGSEGATVQALLHGDVPSVRDVRPELDPRWDAWLGKALARSPEARFQSAREMHGALEHIPGARGVGAADDLARLVTSFMSGELVEEPAESVTPAVFEEERTERLKRAG